MKIKTPYGQKHKRVQVSFPDPTLCKQSFKEECDINHILSKYNKTGVLEHVIDSKARYGDFVGVDDYHASLDKVMASEALFDGLPSDLRTRFDNDPALFLEFVANPDNKSEMIELGLMKDPAVSEKIRNTKTSQKSENSASEKDVAEKSTVKAT